MNEPQKRVDAAIAVVARHGKILICQRRHDTPFGGYWEFPGGKVEPGESVEECLRRELREEVAIEARPVHSFSIIEHDYAHAHVRLHPFLCEHVKGEPQAIGCQQAIWIDPNDLREYELPPANDGLIDEVIAHFKQRQS